MKIKRRIVEAMFSHAKKEIPLEACGYLAVKDGIVIASYELTNIDKSPEHFSFDPKEQFRVLRDARAKGLNIEAVYHSHPNSPAHPSQEDIKLAYDPDKLYAIISLFNNKEDLKIFRILKESVEEEILEVIDVD
jgi:proteasome lid subunit RPN8/RPN11